MKPPGGLDDLEGVAASATENALITLPAAWLRDLLAYVRHLEAERGETPDGVGLIA